MLSWIQGLIADGISFILMLIMLIGSAIAGFAFGRGSTWLSWLCGIVAFIGFVLIFGPILDALERVG